MNKKEFLLALENELAGLPVEAIARSLEYYREMIEDMVEDGMTENEAVATIGDVDNVASQIIMDIPLPRLVGEKLRPTRTLKVWELVLLIIGFPLWGSLLLTAAVLVLAAYILLWSAAVVVYSVAISFAAGTVAGFVGGAAILYSGNGAAAMLYIGFGLICVGAAILTFFLSLTVSRLMVKLSRMIVNRIKSMFVRKGRYGEAS